MKIIRLFKLKVMELLAYIAIGLFLIILPIIPMPLYLKHVIILILFYAYLGTAWNILSGYCGQLSLGNAAFLGLGAYFMFFLSYQKLDPRYAWLNICPWISMFIAGVISAAAAVAIGYPCFRFGVRGAYFVLTSIAFSEVLRYLFTFPREVTAGSLGLFLPYLGDNLYYFQFSAKWPYYYVLLALWILSILIIKVMKRTFEFFIAIREDEIAAASLGVSILKLKLIATALNGFLTGLGGAFYLQYFRYINPDVMFGLHRSIEIATYGIFGGMYSLYGPTLGAIILMPIEETLRIWLGGAYAGAYLIIYGTLLILTIRFLPKGVCGYLEESLMRIEFFRRLKIMEGES